MQKKSSYRYALVLVGTLTGCATTLPPVPDSPQGSHNLIGYLSPQEIPDSGILLPRPPLINSAQQVADELAYQRGLALRDTERWKIARNDSNLHHYPDALAAFTCAMGFNPSETATPNLVMLLRRTKADAVLATKSAKEAYRRQRPFVSHNAHTCDPSDETRLAKQGGYPSGHAATGFAWALILSELIPSRRNVLLERGYTFGQSRVICGYHWQSDVDAGRLVGAATFSALHANAAFNAQLAAARSEIEAQLTVAQPVTTSLECTVERKTLANTP